MAADGSSFHFPKLRSCNLPLSVIKLGLIGAGRWGRNYITTIKMLDGVRLVRLASRNPESRELVGPACIVSPDWGHLVEAGDLDGIIVATPPALHAEITSAAMNAGIPVLVEKPFTLSLESAIALRDLARGGRRLVMVDHTHLFQPAFEELKRRAPGLGAIRIIDAEAGNQGPFREDVPVLWDWGPHDVAMCLDLLHRPPKTVRAVRESRKQVSGGAAETLRLELIFPREIEARIRLSNMIQKTRRFRVHCDTGSLVFDDLASDKLVLERGRDQTPVPVSAEAPLKRVVKAFAAAIATGANSTEGLDLAVEVVGILERCAQALDAA